MYEKKGVFLVFDAAFICVAYKLVHTLYSSDVCVCMCVWFLSFLARSYIVECC